MFALQFAGGIVVNSC